MSELIKVYGKAMISLWNNEVHWDDGNVKLMLLDDGHTPDLDAHDYVDDVRSDEVSGTGYTADGQALDNCSAAYIASSSGTAWQASTSYSVGDVVSKTTDNGHLYICVVAGTSDSGEPTWPTVAHQTVADNDITWAEIGPGMFTLDADDETWTTVTITPRYGVIYYDNGGADATLPLLFLLVFNVLFFLLAWRRFLRYDVR